MRVRPPRLLPLAACATVIFLIGPLIVVLLQSLADGAVTNLVDEGPSAHWYRELFEARDRWRGPVATSLMVAVVTVLIVVPVGICGGVGIARHLRRSRSLGRLLAILPLIVPTVITGMALLSALQGTPLLFSLTGVIAGHVVLTLPYAVLLIDRHVSQSSQEPELAAKTLGAGTWQTFRWVSMPMIAPAVVTAAVFVFYNSWEEVVVTSFVSGTNTKTLPVAIFEAVQNEVSPVLAALSTVLILATAGLFVAYVGVRRLGSIARDRGWLGQAVPPQRHSDGGTTA
jgi:ABC-type spermidine/putrescine transport system permease subunit II